MDGRNGRGGSNAFVDGGPPCHEVLASSIAAKRKTGRREDATAAASAATTATASFRSALTSGSAFQALLRKQSQWHPFFLLVYPPFHCSAARLGLGSLSFLLARLGCGSDPPTFDAATLRLLMILLPLWLPCAGLRI
ncbi:hypothetical protein ACJQWK_00923 [Exserohilum turcicum]